MFFIDDTSVESCLMESIVLPTETKNKARYFRSFILYHRNYFHFANTEALRIQEHAGTIAIEEVIAKPTLMNNTYENYREKRTVSNSISTNWLYLLMLVSFLCFSRGHGFSLVSERQLSRMLIKKNLPMLMKEFKEWPFLDETENFKILYHHGDRKRCVEMNDWTAILNFPKISLPILPKGFERFIGGGKLVFDPQRRSHVQEFLLGLRGEEEAFTNPGVLLGGPNGVGKSSISFLSFLTAFARDILVCYIPHGLRWVGQSETKNEAYQYFLQELFHINADLIVDSVYSSFFQEQLEGEDPNPVMYKKLASALSRKKIPKIGMIIDEAQALFEAKDKIFFQNDFTRWTSLSASFPSQLCASCMGLRDTLPSGESHRIRTISPFSSEVARVLVTNKYSPFYIRSNTNTLVNSTLHWFGGMPRQLEHWISKLKEVEDKWRTTQGKGNKIWEALESEKDEVGSTLYKLFMLKFYEKLDSSTKKAVYAGLRKVLLGTFPRGELLKEAYDYGLLYYNVDDKQVPANKIAEKALSSIYCKLTTTESLEISLDSQNRQGSNFEDQVMANICRNGKIVKGVSYTTMIDENLVTKDILLQAESLHYFSENNLDELFEDLSPLRGRTLWKSTNESYVCDGILFPQMSFTSPIESSENDIIIFDTSITNPYHPERKLKMKRLKQKAKEISNLTKKYQAFVNCNIIIIGMWNHDFKEENNAKSMANFAPQEVPEYKDCYVLEKKELSKLFIKF